MTVPGADPNYPPYGRGDGRSALAVGADAFEVPPIDPGDIRTQAEPRYSRREMKADRQELGFAIPSMAAFNPEPMANRPTDNYPDTPPLPHQP